MIKLYAVQYRITLYWQLRFPQNAHTSINYPIYLIFYSVGMF